MSHHKCLRGSYNVTLSNCLFNFQNRKRVLWKLNCEFVLRNNWVCTISIGMLINHSKVAISDCCGTWKNTEIKFHLETLSCLNSHGQFRKKIKNRNLTHFMLVVSFYTPWKYQKNFWYFFWYFQGVWKKTTGMKRVKNNQELICLDATLPFITIIFLFLRQLKVTFTVISMFSLVP